MIIALLIAADFDGHRPKPRCATSLASAQAAQLKDPPRQNAGQVKLVAEEEVS